MSDHEAFDHEAAQACSHCERGFLIHSSPEGEVLRPCERCQPTLHELTESLAAHTPLGGHVADFVQFMQGDARFRASHYVWLPNGTIRPAANYLEWTQRVLNNERPDGRRGPPVVAQTDLGELGFVSTVFWGQDSRCLIGDPQYLPHVFETMVRRGGPLLDLQRRTVTEHHAQRLHALLVQMLTDGRGRELKRQINYMHRVTTLTLSLAIRGPEEKLERVLQHVEAFHMAERDLLASLLACVAEGMEPRPDCPCAAGVYWCRACQNEWASQAKQVLADLEES